MSLWATGNYVELRFLATDAYSIHQPGPADEAVAAVCNKTYMKLQLDKLSPDKVRAELKEYGAWDDNELADDEQNRHRLVWVMACNAAEEHFLETQ